MNLVIRVDPKADEGLVGRPFLYNRLVVVATPDMTVPTDGIVPAVVRGRDPASSWTIDTSTGEHTMTIDPVLRLSSLVMIRDAVRLGAGAAKLPLSLVSRDIARGRLITHPEKRVRSSNSAIPRIRSSVLVTVCVEGIDPTCEDDTATCRRPDAATLASGVDGVLPAAGS